MTPASVLSAPGDKLHICVLASEETARWFLNLVRFFMVFP